MTPRLSFATVRGAPARAGGLHLGPEPADPARAAWRATELAIGQRFGLIAEARELAALPELPDIRACVAMGPRWLPDWRLYMPVEGTGISLDVRAARVAAVFEAVERYCAMAPVPGELIVRASRRELGQDAVDHESLALLSDRQYRRHHRLEPLTDDKVIDWRRAYSLTRGREVLIPAALVHFSHVGKPPNNFLAELGSTGAASHVSLARAILAGLCEVLERDALAIAWHNRLPLASLDPAGTAVQELLAGAGRDGPEVSLFAVPSDSPFAVILALARDPARYPHAVVGAACRHDPTEAATKAVYETYQILRRLRPRRAVAPERIRRFDHHAELYATRRGAQLLARNLPLAAATERLATLASAATDGDLAATVTALAGAGREVLVAELTTADAAQAGVRVVRVLVPGAVDVSMDGRFPRLGSGRLRDLPVSLGLRGEPLPESRLNLLPVPLA